MQTAPNAATQTTNAVTAAASIMRERWHISSVFTPPENPLAPNSSKLCCTARDPHSGVLYRRAKQPVKYGGARE